MRRLHATGTLSSVAGRCGEPGFAGDGGPAIEARLNWVHGIAVDSYGDIYIADTSNHRIRRIDANGIITTVGGGAAPR